MLRRFCALALLIVPVFALLVALPAEAAVAPTASSVTASWAPPAPAPDATRGQVVPCGIQGTISASFSGGTNELIAVGPDGQGIQQGDSNRTQDYANFTPGPGSGTTVTFGVSCRGRYYGSAGLVDLLPPGTYSFKIKNHSCFLIFCSDTETTPVSIDFQYVGHPNPVLPNSWQGQGAYDGTPNIAGNDGAWLCAVGERVVYHFDTPFEAGTVFRTRVVAGADAGWAPAAGDQQIIGTPSGEGIIDTAPTTFFPPSQMIGKYIFTSVVAHKYGPGGVDTKVPWTLNFKCKVVAEVPKHVILPTVKCDGLQATIVGTEKSDVIKGTDGDDVIVALGGNDKILGKGGNDVICAGDGNDSIDAGTGADEVFGGKGNDTVSYFGRKSAVKVYLNGAPQSGSVLDGRRDLIAKDVENIIGGNGSDTLVGSGFSNKIYGQAGNDTIYGLGGNDLLVGGSGADTFSGGTGNDSISAKDGLRDRQIATGPGADRVSRDAKDPRPS